MIKCLDLREEEMDRKEEERMEDNHDEWPTG